MNGLANKGVKDWLAGIQEGAFKNMSKKQHQILREDVRKITDQGGYVNRIRYDVVPFTDDIFEMRDTINQK